MRPRPVSRMLNRQVKAQFAYKKGELKDKDIKEIMEAVPLILKDDE